MSLSKTFRRIAAASAVAVAGIGSAHAHLISVQTNSVNFPFAAPVAALPGMVSPNFAHPGGASRFVVHFASECSVNAPAGNTTAWTDVDILLLTGGGALVGVLAPTAGNMDAFCSSDGSAVNSGWQSNAVIAVSPINLPAGVYRVQVRAKLNNGATGAMYGERTLLVTR